ncbi:polyphosphate kinase 1 [Aeoliella mucimassa]|uniref:Polyphosphate kinase n=1 Tax=Aeoliella mucimassa TaxID=2527972 RepID=A0A518ASW6_9BACT|nr:polyphosphate kinase 1 [Aeoliella mucimassa]QDU57820.1 Polyphosphate kinase [Aeoliella mucimassa]
MSDTVFLPEHMINRELSWLEFNARVLEEAQDESNPLLERAKFLAIFTSNLDEFFMVRVAGLREQIFGGMTPQDKVPDGLSPIEQLHRISQRTRELVSQQYDCWNNSIRPQLEKHQIRILDKDELSASQQRNLDKFFTQRVFPVVTPMAIDPSHPSPRFHNRGLYLAANLKRRSGMGPETMFAVVQLPSVMPRFIPVEPDGTTEFVLLEDLVGDRLSQLFGGYDIENYGTFRITRDMDVELLEQEGDDMLRAIEARLRARQRSEAVRLEISNTLHRSLRDRIIGEEAIHHGDPGTSRGYDEVYSIDGMLDMTGLFELAKQAGHEDLQDPPFTPRVPERLAADSDLFARIAEHDILLHHPFDSFRPVVRFVQQAAHDPNVLAIKQTLYRTSGDSPIVQALMEAAENGKQVTALVELQARFDEANNISWARQMERAGVHVVFGFMKMKTHSKLAMVVRQEGNKVRRYVHLGTGNYNPTTAKLYTDVGLFTSDKDIADDANALFNFLTGYSQEYSWKELVVSPQYLHQKTLDLINEQTDRARQGKSARILAKLNSLVDRETVHALYRASQAGVEIDLVIRGICCLRPGLPGISENIRVRSIVDRFLEHTRILVFGEGSRQKVFASSADWMPRNFERRVEVMFPIQDPLIRQKIVEGILPVYLADNQRARVLNADGTYSRVVRKPSDPPRRSQMELLGLPVVDHEVAAPKLMEAASPQRRSHKEPKKNAKPKSRAKKRA